MGKKGSWLSVFKRVFVPNSKEKLEKGAEKKVVKENKKGRGISTHGESRSFIPLFRGPSSIEKILGEADFQQIQFRPPTHYEQPKTSFALPAKPPSPTNASLKVVPPRTMSPKVTSPKVTSPRVTSPKVMSPRVTSPRATLPRVTSPRATLPRVTSPRAMSPKVTSPWAKSPRAMSPRVTSPWATSPRVSPPRPVSRKVSSPRPASPRAASLRTAQPRVYRPRPEPTLRNHHLSAVKIQSAYRGYMARRSFKALRSLVRLQGVVRGQSVKRQTMNAMKQMQLLVRVQTQIQSRRIQILENQAVQRSQKNENGLSKAGDHEDWDDSLLTKEEVDARTQKKREAILKRERAMAYACLNQGNQKADQTPLVDIRSGGFPWWLTWLERQIPREKPSKIQPLKKFLLTPSRPTPENKLSPRPQSSNYRQHSSMYENLETPTPKSSKSTTPFRTRQMFTPSSTPTTGNSMKYSRPRNSAANSTFIVPLKDDDSLMSCPPFSVPNYMAQTVSAKAKVRSNSNSRERFLGTPDSETSSKRRFSFPMTPTIVPFKWNKGSIKDSPPPMVFEKRQPLNFTGDRSIDSTVSMPAAFGRKPFNGFV